MNEFAQTADTIKESIIQEYSKANPDIPENCVLEKSKSGALVFETIDTLFANMNSHDTAAETSPDLAYSLLTVDEDERYMDCAKSSKQTQQMCEYLANDKTSKINILERNRIADLLKKREWLCANQGAESRIAKREMMKMMDTLETTLALVENSVAQFLSATEKQLACQHDILEEEVKISGEFAPTIKNYFSSIYRSIGQRKRDASAEQLGKAYAILRQKKTVSQEEALDLNKKLLDQSLSQFEKHVEKRKMQVDEIKAFLPVVKKLSTLLGQGAGAAPSTADASSPKPDESSNRMAFMSNALNRLFSRKK